MVTPYMPASPDEVEEAKEENIAIQNGWGPVRVVTENGRVTGVEFHRCVSVFNACRCLIAAIFSCTRFISLSQRALAR